MAHLIYIIGEVTEGPCKIGISTNVERRLSTFQSGNPRPLMVFGTWALARLSDAERLEVEVHKLLSTKRLFREWFSVTVEEASSAIIETLRFGTETGFDRDSWRKATFLLRPAKMMGGQQL